ncbi:hypothetical protein I3843_07G082500 [Carya illinoinensis]|nr:hypothetical protein I3843_07G082500 [Carya illinoinensis]
MSSASHSCTSLERPLCYCGCQAKLRISGKANTFGRRFFNCPNYKMNKQCGFFEWIDLQSQQKNCHKMTLELAERRHERGYFMSGYASKNPNLKHWRRNT